MNKFIFLLFILLSINIVSAERLVNYHFYEGIIDEEGNFRTTNKLLDYVSVVGFTCLDNNCEDLGKIIFPGKNMNTGGISFNNGILNSEYNSYIQLSYPTELQSNFGYGVYYFKDGYILWESNPNWWGNNPNDPQGPFNVYLSKKEGCSSTIKEFTIRNSEKVNSPVVINVKADLDLKTESAINEAGPLKAVPEILKEHYSVNTLISLSVQANGENVFFEEKEVLIEYEKEGVVEFNFVTEEEGDYNAIITVEVIDDKCLSSTVSSERKQFIVMEEYAQEKCYTELNNLELSNNFINTDEPLIVSFNKLSNLQIDKENNIIQAIPTMLKVELKRELDGINEVVFEKEFELEENQNSIDVTRHDIIINLPDNLVTGYYDLVLTGTGNEERCGLDNKENELSDEIFINNPGFFNHAPEIISEPATVAKLGETYLYDVDAVDPDNDEIEYSLVEIPFVIKSILGMNIDSSTGLISWNVDENLFKKGDKFPVLVKASDGFFMDFQVFFIEVKRTDKETKKIHNVKFSGLELETSSVEEGISGLLQIKNNGNFKEKNTLVTADIYELDVHEVLGESINLGEEDSIWVPISIKIPGYAEEGDYLVNIRLSNSKYSEEHKIVVFINKNK